MAFYMAIALTCLLIGAIIGGLIVGIEMQSAIARITQINKILANGYMKLLRWKNEDDSPPD